MSPSVRCISGRAVLLSTLSVGLLPGTRATAQTTVWALDQPPTAIALTDTVGLQGPSTGGEYFKFPSEGALAGSPGTYLFADLMSGGGGFTPPGNYWLHDSGVNLPYFAGDTGPLSGYTFNDFDFDIIRFNRNNTLVTGVDLDGGAGDSGALAGFGANGSFLIAQNLTDDPVLGPGLGPGVVFPAMSYPRVASPFSIPSLNDGGQIGYWAILEGPGINYLNNRGIYRWDETNGNALLARNGTADAALGPNIGTRTFSGFFNKTRIDDAGDVFYRGTLNLKPGDGTDTRYGLWRSAAAGPVPIAVEGIEAIGAGVSIQGANEAGGRFFWRIDGEWEVNRHGDVAMIASFTDGNFTEGLDVVVVNRGGENIPLTKSFTDDAVYGPQLGPGIVFDEVEKLAISDSGKVAFIARIDGPGINRFQNDTGIWLADENGIELIAQEGMPITGTGIADGTTLQISSINANSALGLSINVHNQIVFEAGIKTGNSSNSALFAYSDGELIRIVGYGDMLDADPGLGIQLEEVSGIRMTFDVEDPNDFGIGRALTDDGRIVFQTSIRQSSIRDAVWVAQLPMPELPGDFDGDGDVDGVDLGVMFANFNGPGGGVPTNPDTDLDGDGDVDGVDLAAVFAVFTGPLTPTNVPEPGTLGLLAFAGLLGIRKRHSGRPFRRSPARI